MAVIGREVLLSLLRVVVNLPEDVVHQTLTLPRRPRYTPSRPGGMGRNVRLKFLYVRGIEGGTGDDVPFSFRESFPYLILLCITPVYTPYEGSIFSVDTRASEG
jgi:hypothetical protein